MASSDARIETLSARLAVLEQRTADEAAAIRAELHELRTEQAGSAPVRPPVAAAPPIWPPVAAAAPREPADFSWLTGPRALALAGGAVTLLGIVFLFALAASRGWIGPAVRCSIGGGVSALLVGAALVARQRFGQVAAALAAAGAGIGGFYVTLYAASRGYHLLGTGFVWAAVVAVAGLAAAMALAWSSELLAVLGLVAVVAAPPAVEGKLTGLGLGASVLAAAVALGLGQERRWRVLGGLAFGLTLVQVAVYIVDSRWHTLDDLGGSQVEWAHRGTAALLACAVLALALAGAAAYQRRSGQLDWFAAALASVSLPFALLSVWALVHGTDGRGTTLLGLAAVYAASAVAFSRLPGEARHFADLPVACSLFAVALATATYLSNGGLLTAWTLEGLALTALAARSGRKGYQAAGLAYFAAAGAHLFVFEVPLTHLFSQRLHPAQHIVELLLMIASLTVAALLLRGRELLFPRLDLAAATTAGLLGLYAGSLGMLQASQELGGADLHASFQRGETLVSALWALAALALLSAGFARRGKELRRYGLALLGLALAKLFLFDLSQLSSLTRAGSFLAVGLALLAGGLLVQRLSRNGRPPGPVAGQL